MVGTLRKNFKISYKQTLDTSEAPFTWVFIRVKLVNPNSYPVFSTKEVDAWAFKMGANISQVQQANFQLDPKFEHFDVSYIDDIEKMRMAQM